MWIQEQVLPNLSPRFLDSGSFRKKTSYDSLAIRLNLDTYYVDSKLVVHSPIERKFLNEQHCYYPFTGLYVYFILIIRNLPMNGLL